MIPFTQFFLSFSHCYLLLLVLIAVIICSNRFDFSALSFISFALPLILTLFLMGIFGSLTLAIAISCSLIIIIQLFNQLKNHYYKERLFFPDLKVMFDPQNFETLYRYPMALLAIIGLIVFLCCNIWLYHSSIQLNSTIRLVSALIAVILCITLFFIGKQQHVTQQWETLLPKGTSTLTNLYLSAQQIAYQAPCYTEESLYFENRPSIKNSLPQTKADIIVVLQESTLNPQALSAPSNITLPSYAMFEPKPHQDTGTLRVQTFGGATWLSEFSILTGLNTDDFQYRKNCVFYTVAPHIKYSIFNELKRNGYFTVVLTPMHPLNYNAGPTYEALGVDLILQPQDLGYNAPSHTNLWDISSAEMLDYAKQTLARYTDKPLFIFMLTMAEHGPYNHHYPDELQLGKSFTNKKDVAEINDYLHRLKLLDDATQDLKNHLQAQTRPTLLCYFGDHQPSINWNMPYLSEQPNPDYLTQFTIWDNFSHDVSIPLAEETDLSFLPGLLLEKLNLELSPFFAANIKMRQLTKGKLDYHSDKKLVNSYKNYIYQKIKQAG